MDKLAAGLSKMATDTDTNADVVATITKPATGGRLFYLQGFIISARSGTPTAVTATITGPEDGTISIEIPANEFAPMVKDFGNHPLRCNADIVLTIPSMGASRKASGQVFAITA